MRRRCATKPRGGGGGVFDDPPWIHGSDLLPVHSFHVHSGSTQHTCTLSTASSSILFLLILLLLLLLLLQYGLPITGYFTCHLWFNYSMSLSCESPSSQSMNQDRYQADWYLVCNSQPLSFRHVVVHLHPPDGSAVRPQVG